MTTARDYDPVVYTDLIKFECAASLPDQLWVADITYMPTGADFFRADGVDDLLREFPDPRLHDRIRFELRVLWSSRVLAKEPVQ